VIVGSGATGRLNAPGVGERVDAVDELLFVWRHPRAIGAEGRCIGRTDLAVDPRKAKRLAHRIQRLARQQRLPKIVLTSALRRSLAVGQWLARWGWHHRVDPALAELDFGRWDGLHWRDVPQAEIDAWCRDFADHRPGGGECVQALLQRVRRWQPGAARIAVSHGGWLSAALWLATEGEAVPRSECWPAAPVQGRQTRFARGLFGEQ
jgi:alpha-ribazole phosphatase